MHFHFIHRKKAWFHTKEKYEQSFLVFPVAAFQKLAKWIAHDTYLPGTMKPHCPTLGSCGAGVVCAQKIWSAIPCTRLKITACNWTPCNAPSLAHKTWNHLSTEIFQMNSCLPTLSEIDASWKNLMICVRCLVVLPQSDKSNPRLNSVYGMPSNSTGDWIQSWTQIFDISARLSFSHCQKWN